MLSEATFDQLVELPGVGQTRAQQFLQLREEAGGEVTGSWLCNIGGVDWKGLADSGKIVFKGDGADVGLLGWVGNEGVLEWGSVPEEVPMDPEKVTSKINEEVDSKVEDRFLKHELQMQLMAENMEGIMQMIAHRLDTLEKKCLHGDKKEEVNQRWKLPTFDGTSKWGPYAKQAGVIFEMNNCTDPKWRAFKIIEGLRGKATEYFDTLPVEVGKDGELLCKEMFSRFDGDEPGLSLRSKLYQVAQKKGESIEEFAERVRCMAVRAFPSLERAGVELYSVEFFLKGLGNKRTSLAVLDKAPDSIGKAVDWAKNFEANVSWVGEDSKARIVEEMTDEGQVYRLEGGHKGGRCFSCGEVGHMAGSCPRNAWSKNGKKGFKGNEWVGVGRGRGKCFGCGEEGHYVGQCLKAPPRKCFSCGEIGHLSLQCRRGPMCFNCRELGHTAVSCPKLRHLND